MSEPTTAAAATEPPPAPSLVKKLIAKVPLNLLRFWWAFVMVPGIAIGTASVVASAVASTSWTFKSTILYTPIPVGDAAEKLYSPPDLKTMATMITSPVVIQRVCEDLDLPIPPKALASLITIEEPKSMQRIGLELGWDDPDLGREILDKLTEVYGDYISSIRQDLVSGYLKDLDGNLGKNAKRLGAAQEALRQFNSRENVRDAEAELEHLITSIGTLEFKLETEQRERKDLEAQHANVTDRLARQKEEAALESEKAKEAEAAEESVADNRRRQDRLNELIVEERRLNEIRAALFAAQQEFDRKLKLYDNGYISRAEFETIEAQVKALKSRIMEGDKIDKWKAELATIDKVVVPSGGNKRKGSPVIQQTLFKLIEIELDILTKDSQCNQLRLSISDKRRNVRRLQSLEQESTRLAKEVDAASGERDMLNAQLTALQAIHDYGNHEFTVVAPATSAMHHPSSNRKKMFILVFGALTMLLCAPFALLAVLLSLKQTIDEGCADRGLAVLTPRKSLLAMLTDAGTSSEREIYGWSRYVALRIQQLAPRAGSTVSVFPVGHRQYDVVMLTRIGSVLVDRDERVLIIETSRPIESAELSNRRRIYGVDAMSADSVVQEVQNRFGAERPGLFDYLHDRADSIEELLARGGGEANVDFISCGQHDGRFDRLFSTKMSKLLEQLRSDYSLILMYGPELHRTVDAELLARHSDGIVYLHDRGEPLSHGLRTTMDSLVDLNAPVWGSIVRPRAFAAPDRPRLLRRLLCQVRSLVSALRKKNRQQSFFGSLLRLPLRIAFFVPATSFRVFRTLLGRLARRRKKSAEPADLQGSRTERPAVQTPLEPMSATGPKKDDSPVAEESET